MKGGVESLVNTIEQLIATDELKRVDIHTDKAKVCIYKVTDKLVRIDVKFA